MHLLVGNEARPDQAVRGEVGDPHRVVHIRFAAGNRLDVSRVGEDEFEIAVAQYLPHGTPIDPGRLHRHDRAPARAQPFQQPQEPVRRRRKSPTFPRRLVPRHRAHARNHGVLVNVQPRDAIMDRFHSRLLSLLLPLAAGEGALQIRNPNKRAPERRRPWRKSGSSKRPRSNSGTSFTASVSHRPLADSTELNARRPENPFHPTGSAEGRCATQDEERLLKQALRVKQFSLPRCCKSTESYWPCARRFDADDQHPCAVICKDFVSFDQCFI